MNIHCFQVRCQKDRLIGWIGLVGWHQNHHQPLVKKGFAPAPCALGVQEKMKRLIWETRDADGAANKPKSGSIISGEWEE